MITIKTEHLHFPTQGNTDILDITPQVQEMLKKAKLKNGIVVISVVGSTAGLTTCEYEPGLVQDLKDLFKKIIPQGHYNHDQAWGDGNGHSHLRASLLGPSLSLAFSGGELTLGTWQQVILIDFDTRPRKRDVVVQIIGE